MSHIEQTDTDRSVSSRRARAGERSAGRDTRRKKSLLAPGASPEDILDQIRALVTDNPLVARRMAVEAAAQFPNHEGLRTAHRVLNVGKASVNSGGTEPSTTEEFDWLRRAPESVRGKWVALVGQELVGMADTLTELTDALRAKRFDKPALVHRVD